MFWIDLVSILCSIYCIYCALNMLFRAINGANDLYKNHQTFLIPLLIVIGASILVYCCSIPADLVIAKVVNLHSFFSPCLMAITVGACVIFHSLGIDKL